jgi:AraC-like DNA-binding protein
VPSLSFSLPFYYPLSEKIRLVFGACDSQTHHQSVMSAKFSYNRLEFRDIEADRFKHVLDGANVEHTVTSRQAGHAIIEQFHGSHFSIDLGNYAFPIVARGQFAPGCICIGMAFGSRTTTWINGFSTGDGHLQIYSEGTDLLYRAGPDASWIGLTITREKLQMAALARLGRELKISFGSNMEHWRIDDAAHVRLAQLVRSVIPKPGNVPREPADTEAAIVGAYLEALASAEESIADQVRKRAACRLDVLRRATDAMQHLVGSSYSSSRLCRHLGMSERNLELYFQEALGLSPKAWFQHIALRQARRKLLRDDSCGASVTRIALDCGFEHLGRFSESYRKLFGELPSDTLRRTRPTLRA